LAFRKAWTAWNQPPKQEELERTDREREAPQVLKSTDKLRQIEGVVADTFSTYAGAMEQIREVRAILAAQEADDAVGI
jgi:glutamate/tyrosine decarboxylase-like PLP-dependent enzyme